MRKTNLIIIIIAVLILVGLSLSFGIFLGRKVTLPEVQESGLKPSKLISQATARGEVVGISERILTLAIQEETLTMPISQDAKIVGLQELAEGEKRRFEEKEIEFGAIKVGDVVTIELQPKEGKFEGAKVSIWPPGVL